MNKSKNSKWTTKETKLLRNLYQTAPIDKLLTYLPGRTKESIKSKASSLSLKKIVSSREPIQMPVYEDKEFYFRELTKEGEKIKFAVVSDTHFISKYQQLTHLKNFYEHVKNEGCKLVFHVGDFSDGNGSHYIGQMQEIFKYTLKDQIDYIVKNYPRDLPTYAISGAHDLDWFKMGASDVLEEVSKQRSDIRFLGQHGAYFMLNNKIRIYLMHPMGGTSYAMSYKPQKFIEGFSGGTKPQILLLGHYHQAGYFVYRNVHSLLTGCFQSQTPYLVRKGLQPQMGGWIVEIEVGKDSSLNKFTSTFVPFYIPHDNDY